MDLFEYQGKELLRRFEVPVPEGRVATSPEEAAEAARGLGGRVVVKAQVQIGARGKQGGIKVVGSPEEAAEAARAIFELTFYEQNTFALIDKRAKGATLSAQEEQRIAKAVPIRAKRVLIERAGDIASEYYCSFLVDRSNRGFMAMFSREGGMDIEAIAEEDRQAKRADPSYKERIVKVQIDPLLGISDFHARRLVFASGIEPEARAGVIGIIPKLYRAFVELDASQIEINPLVLTADGKVMALDAKVTLDDSAAFRHPFFDELKAVHDVPEQERIAKDKGLNYIQLDGNVGIIGNGAGLVMSTLDVVKDAGGEPANFLDVGGGAGADVLSAGLEVIMSNPGVKSVLVNIFGGITRCDLVAEGILDALGRLDVKVPIVVRLDGTNAEQGRKMLADAPHPMLVTADSMLGAAQKAVELVGGGR